MGLVIEEIDQDTIPKAMVFAARRRLLFTRALVANVD